MKTTNLRSLSYRVQPHMPLLIFLGVIALLFVVNGRREHAHIDTLQPTPALIYVLSTPVPTVAPTPDQAMQIEIAALKARVAELEADRSAAVAEPQGVYQEMAAPQATPYVADPQIEYSTAGSTVQITVPTDAPRLCDGFGDWRDYDAMYQSSPACHKTP